MIFERQMSAGKIHAGHPELLAQAFLGMFFAYAVLPGFLSDTIQPKLSSHEIVDQFVEIFVRGTRTIEE